MKLKHIEMQNALCLVYMSSIANSKNIVYILTFFYKLLQSRFARNISLGLDSSSFEPKLEIVAFLWKPFMMPSIRADNSRRYSTSTIIYDSNWARESAWKSSSSRDPARIGRGISCLLNGTASINPGRLQWRQWSETNKSDKRRNWRTYERREKGR